MFTLFGAMRVELIIVTAESSADIVASCEKDMQSCAGGGRIRDRTEGSSRTPIRGTDKIFILNVREHKLQSKERETYLGIS